MTIKKSFTVFIQTEKLSHHSLTKYYCIVLFCIVLYCIVLYCTVLYCIVLYCIALHCIALHCIALHCIALFVLLTKSIALITRHKLARVRPALKLTRVSFCRVNTANPGSTRVKSNPPPEVGSTRVKSNPPPEVDSTRVEPGLG